jgi:ABC-type phosphate transport system substrate-binding protein
LTYGTISGSTVDFGASDAYLTAGQYGLTSTGGYNYTTAVDGASASSATDGPVIQVPSFGTPITIAFTSPTYNTAKTGKPASYKAYVTKLTLTDSQICGVFSGQINDWHTLVSTVPAGTPINVVYRSDSSGTTFLLTNHFYDAGLGDVCNNTNAPAFTGLTAPTKVFTSLFTGGTVPAGFVMASGSGGVQAVLLADAGTKTTPGAGAIGYLSPDYTDIAPKAGATYSKAVLTAAVVNFENGKAYTPTAASALLALEHPSTESQVLSPPTSKSTAENPLNWVPNIPMATEGYPIVGYTTLDLSTCYSDPTVGTALKTFLTDLYTNKSFEAITKNNGFTALPAAFITAIKADFLSNTSGYALDIGDTAVCTGGLAGR